MAHTHPVQDDDLYFWVDPTSKKLINRSVNPLSFMQDDHNSEEITFEIPRMIEGHDMLECDVVQVHYTNISNGTSVSNRYSNNDIYEINDLKVNPENEDNLICTWLVSDNATMYAGTLKFQLKFKCTDSDDPTKFSYKWNTKPFVDVTVDAGLNFTPDVVERGSDIIEQWRVLIFENGAGIPINIQNAITLDNILSTASDDDVGKIYRYIGESTDKYEYGALYMVEKE